MFETLDLTQRNKIKQGHTSLFSKLATQTKHSELIFVSGYAGWLNA